MARRAEPNPTRDPRQWCQVVRLPDRFPRANPKTREGKIALLVDIDPNGSYHDSWRNAEGNEPLTVAELDALLNEFRDNEAPFWCVVDSGGRVVSLDSPKGEVQALGLDRVAATALALTSPGWSAREEPYERDRRI